MGLGMTVYVRKLFQLPRGRLCNYSSLRLDQSLGRVQDARNQKEAEGRHWICCHGEFCVLSQSESQCTSSLVNSLPWSGFNPRVLLIVRGVKIYRERKEVLSI